MKGNEEEGEDIEFIGALGDNESSINNLHARKQREELKETYERNAPEDTRDEMIPWPSLSREPENEFYGIKIF